jgi:hypothetical protein
VSGFSFRSRIAEVGSVDAVVDRDVIHAEPMLFGASVEFAREAGGPLTRIMLNALTEELTGALAYCRSTSQHLVIDTRSHMLMPGFTPAIPGWHCDAYPRGAYGEQPWLANGNPSNFHFVCFVSDQADGVSRTEFMQSGVTTNIRNVDPEHVWASVHKQAYGDTMTQVDGQILRFWQPTLHRAKPAHAKGWRWWFRASVFYRPPENAIRKQVQVYAPEGLGW